MSRQRAHSSTLAGPSETRLIHSVTYHIGIPMITSPCFLGFPCVCVSCVKTRLRKFPSLCLSHSQFAAKRVPLFSLPIPNFLHPSLQCIVRVSHTKTSILTCLYIYSNAGLYFLSTVESATRLDSTSSSSTNCFLAHRKFGWEKQKFFFI